MIYDPRLNKFRTVCSGKLRKYRPNLNPRVVIDHFQNR